MSALGTTDASPVSSPQPPIGAMFGPPLVGIMVSCMFFGSLWNQCLMYFTRYPKDKLWIKSYVLTLLVLDIIGTIFAIWWIYDLLVTNFGVYTSLSVVTFRLAIHPTLVGVQAILCQSFFIWRVKVLTQKLWLCIPLFLGCFVSLGCTVGLTVYISIHTNMTAFYNPPPHALGAIWLSTTAFVDVSITCILTYFFRTRKTGVVRTDHILNRIIAGTLQNGLITSACAIVELAAFLGLPNSGLHIAFVFLLPKVYCNTVLSSLNARHRAGRNSIYTIAGTIDLMSNQPRGVQQSMPRFVTVDNTELESHEMRDSDTGAFGDSVPNSSETAATTNESKKISSLMHD